jgi:hypothetical protein
MERERLVIVARNEKEIISSLRVVAKVSRQDIQESLLVGKLSPTEQDQHVASRCLLGIRHREGGICAFA